MQFLGGLHEDRQALAQPHCPEVARRKVATPAQFQSRVATIIARTESLAISAVGYDKNLLRRHARPDHRAREARRDDHHHLCMAIQESLETLREPNQQGLPENAEFYGLLRPPVPYLQYEWYAPEERNHPAGNPDEERRRCRNHDVEPPRSCAVSER